VSRVKKREREKKKEQERKKDIKVRMLAGGETLLESLVGTLGLGVH
jgi:hypothetical protein